MLSRKINSLHNGLKVRLAESSLLRGRRAEGALVICLVRTPLNQNPNEGSVWRPGVILSLQLAEYRKHVLVTNVFFKFMKSNWKKNDLEL